MKFDLYQNDRNENGVFHVNCYKRLADTEMKIFHFARNEISYKHPSKPFNATGLFLYPVKTSHSITPIGFPLNKLTNKCVGNESLHH